MTYPITREQYAELVKPLVDPPGVRAGRPRGHDLYDVVCAILHRERDNLSWRQLAALDVYPVPWRTIHDYHYRWRTPAPYRPGTELLPQVLAALDTTNWRKP